MGKITILKDKLIFERRDELTVIEAYGENCLRAVLQKIQSFLMKIGHYCHRPVRVNVL